MFEFLSPATSLVENLFQPEATGVAPDAATSSFGAMPGLPTMTAPLAAANLFGGLFGDDSAAKAQAEAEAKTAARDADRAKAREELAGMMGGPDGGKPNNMSQEEFDKTVALYSDIRMGDTDIVFDTKGIKDPAEAERLKGLAMKDMAKMMQTGSGRAMLDKLAHNEDEHHNHMSTSIQFIDDNAEASCSRIKHTDDIAKEYAADARDHNGTGNDAIVKYAPGQSFENRGPDGRGVAQTGDSTLFHEMAHAYHRTQGTLADGEVNPVHEYDAGINQAEYQATGLGPYANEYLTENQYRRERMALGEDVTERSRYSPDGRQHAHNHDH